jgi:predicted TIM-barrel fold metal-dependent hydrolase
MGINTRYYELKEINALLTRLFSGYTGRRVDFLSRMGSFNGAIELVGSNVFAGIKLYPPLGFDPWPEEDGGEMDKVVALYDLCAAKQIPITAHCSDGGFCTTSKHEEYTSPKKWRHVLEAFPSLKLNLAHFGKQKNAPLLDTWREIVIELILEHDNVYTDISCLAFNETFYDQLNNILSQDDKLSSRIMFGTDYMMNLLWEESYNSYLLRFIQTNEIDPEIKIKMCNVNPGRFIFS